VGFAGLAEIDGAGGGSFFASATPTVASAPSKTTATVIFIAGLRPNFRCIF
jgi:hypothetical protein